MAAKSPISPTIMEHPEEGSDEPISLVDGIQEQLNNVSIQHGGSSNRKKHPLPSSPLTIHPTPYLSIQSPLISSAPLGSPNNERSYLLENLQRQHQRGERLSHALSNVEVRLASVQSKSEARRLRKEAGLLRSKIAESQKQEQLIMLRLNDIQHEDLIRGELFQAQSAGLVPYQTLWSPYSPMQPWSPMTLPVSPVHPVSPLTPLPPGLCHPSPIVPSPMASPYWLGTGTQHPFFSPVMTNDPSVYLGAHLQHPCAPGAGLVGQASAMAPHAVDSSEHKRKATKSVDFSLPQEEAYTGRRWSLADVFSPTPKDKRMSVPGLQTIWKDKEQPEE